ncbi:MAG: prepilin-type N-terminal cleavage/methylation domain-containing protein [Candidatus Gorgyraea atricola]|nr:prepilin-type N-terminal cleavage/methylation domain-containing protein [Candidatus Gorgyraea atricola]
MEQKKTTLRIGKIGFTLVEMLVVLAIIAMLLGISLPFTSGFGKGLRIKTSARAIMGTLRVARSNAITHREENTVVFDIEEGEYWIEDSTGAIFEKKRRLSRSIEFKVPETEEGEKDDPITFEEDKVTFFSTGAIKGISGSITIADKRGESRTISIIGSTGKITIE